MSEETKQDLLAQYGELSLKMETNQVQARVMGQKMQEIKQQLQTILKDEEEEGTDA